MFAKSILRMGVPVAARNIFPSNIQGLPTWFEVRITEAGHLGRRGGVDMMVAMNPQTWDRDVAEIEPGGYLFYDSTKPLPPSKFRDDIVVVGARPLFMTDYIACGKVVPERIADIVAGIARGCSETRTALVGGETAEHPGLLGPDDYDVAGAAVGAVEADAQHP